LLTACLGALAAAAGAEAELVSRARAAAGLPALTADPVLAAAAAQHAAYLDRHREPGSTVQGDSAHAQLAGREGFSGATPAARALAAGYRHREVLENVSMGYADAADALEHLMSAIYHRLTFLDLEADRLGAARGARSRVFLLGRDDLDRLCAAPPPEALSRAPLDCLGRAIKRSYLERLCSGLPQAALFRSSHPVSCPNGVRLDADYMAGVCQAPPSAARFSGHGRYYAPCDNGTRVDADWFDALCEARPPSAVYPGSGHYYEICEPPQRIHAEWLEDWCAGLPDAALYRDSGRYRRPCADDSDIRVEYLAQLDAARHAALPEVVLWPPDGASDVPPAFFIEDPDPLPDREVSGYPVSIQFNPGKGRAVQIRAFRLFEVRGDQRAPVGPVRLLDAASDPHGLLDAHQFALFPLERLAWGARYVAEVEADVDGTARRITWGFRIRVPDAPLLTAAAARQRFVVRPGSDYLLYLPPSETLAHTVLSTRIEHQRINDVTLDVVDPNTLRLSVQARSCDLFKLQFDDGRVVQLLPAGCGG
jgi:hypothetical protein